MDNRPVRCAMVGLGWWGQLMVESVATPDTALVFTHGFARNAEPVRDFADAHRLELAPSFDTLLRDPAVDAIVLATPHSVHVDQIVACAEAGKPVFCEKPLALSLAEAQRAVAACRAADIVLGLGTDRRMLPAVVRLKALIDEGALGELLHLEAQYSNDNMSRGVSGDWRTSAHETPGGGMTGPGLHALDALLHLGGPAGSLSGQLRQPQGADVPVDTISLMGTLASGTSMLLGCVRGSPNYFRLAAFGTNGWAEVRGFGDLHHCASGGAETVEHFSPELAVGALLQAFGQTVRGDAPFPVTIASMLRSVAAFEAALRAFASTGPVGVEEIPDAA